MTHNRFYNSTNQHPMNKRLDITFIQFFKSALIFSFFPFLLNGGNTEKNIYATNNFDDPEFTIPGFFTAQYFLLNFIPPEGRDLTGDNVPDIFQPCTCRDQAPYANGQNLDNRYFNDQIVVASGVSGEQWLVDFAFNAFDPQTLQPIAINTPIPEIGETGIYLLPVLTMEGKAF